MFFAALGGERGPGGVARGEVELGFVRGFVVEPLGDVGDEGFLVERRGEKPLQFQGGGLAVNGGGLGGADAADGSFLHETAFHGKQRREFVMALLQRGDLARHAEQFADKILDVRREGDDQIGQFLAVERLGMGAGGEQAALHRCVGGGEMAAKRFVDAHQAFLAVKIFKTQIER